MKQANLLQSETDSRRKMKFAEWYFAMTLDPAARTEVMVPRKDFHKELVEKTKSGSMHTLIFAYPGQGKTVSTRYFFNEKTRKDNKIKTIYINCKHHTTEKKIFSAIIDQMVKAFPPVREIAKKNERVAICEFVKHIPDNEKWFLVLDEIDVPITNDKKTHKGEWLTVFFRAENERYVGVSVDGPRERVWHTIMITNKLAFEQSLDRNERQHIQHMGVKPYNPQDVFDILKKRFEVAIQAEDISPDLFSDDMIFRIARDTVDSYDSNIRTAFRLVESCAAQAVQQNVPVNKDHLLEANKNIEIDLLMDDIADIPTNARAFFFSVLIFLKEKLRMSNFKNLEEKGYSYKTFYLGDIFEVFKKFSRVNGLRDLKAIQRSCQSYILEGQKISLYIPTGATKNHNREYKVEVDIKKTWDKVLQYYPMYDFNISLS